MNKDKKWTPPSFYWPLVWCDYSKRIRWHKWRRLNTSYVDERSNWMFSPKDAFDEAWEYYAELWDYYYSSRF